MDVEWLSALAGFTGVTGIGIAGVVWRKTAARRAILRRSPLTIEVARDDSEPGPIWEVATDEILEREDFLDVYSLNEDGLIQPNRFLRETRRRWKAYDVGATLLPLEVYNPLTVPVWIVGIEAEVEERRDAPTGTRISNPPQGELGVLELSIDLDAAVARGRATDGTDYFAGAKREIAPGAREFIGVTANCANGAVSWRLRIRLLIGSQRAEQRFPAVQEPPLLTCGYGPASHYERSWVCSLVVMACDDAAEPPHLHDARLDRV